MGEREEEIESEATIYLVLKGLQGFQEARNPPTHPCRPLLCLRDSQDSWQSTCVCPCVGGDGAQWLEGNSDSAWEPLVIVGACRKTYFTWGHSFA